MDNFNWEVYIQKYPDLVLAGINTKQKAWNHYQKYGKTEGRSFTTNGINNVDIFYYINLNHRTDRNESILSEFDKIGIDPGKINRIEAIYNPGFGMRGATQSHCLTIEKFINSGLENCIIFEDDFIFNYDKETINKKFDFLFNSGLDYDLVMLSASTATETKFNTYLSKVYDSNTASGYLLSKKFAPILLNNFKETDYNDVNWIKLQPISNWYSFLPKLGIQMEGYSDITKKHENYRA